MELARLRLRGAYAIIAGSLLLFIAPVYDALALGPTYAAAVQSIARSRDFMPYLAWLAVNLTTNQVSRVLQTIPFLLALTLPLALSSWLWPDQRLPRRIGVAAGWIGFGAFIIAGVIGLVVSTNAALDFQHAANGSVRSAIALTFAQEYALQTLLSRVVGGVALTVFLAQVSLRSAVATRLPRWLAYLGGLVAALEAANAVFFLLNPLDIQAPTAQLSLAGLAVWLLVIGVALWQVRLPDLRTLGSPPERSDALAPEPPATSGR